MPPPPQRQPRRPTSGAVPAQAPRRPTSGVRAQARPAAKLTAQAGPAEGQEFSLSGDELVIGRAADNPVSINDNSVSRKHALVRKTADGWAVSDLGSGNGTLLNGEPITDETPLSEGDVITMGDTELVYSGGGAAAAAAESGGARAGRAPVRTSRNLGGGVAARPARGRPVRTSRSNDDPEVSKKRKKKLFLIIGGSAVVLLSLLVGGKAIQKKNAEREAIARRAAGEHQAEMSALFKEVKVLVRQGSWDEAQAKLLEMQELDAEYEPRQVENYLRIAGQEIPAQKLLKDATTALAAGELAKTHGLLAKVRTTTQESKLADLRSELDTKTGDTLGEARQLLAFASELAKMEQLKAMCEDMLVVREGDREISELKRQAEQAIERIKNPAAAPVVADTPWTDVSSRFRNGDAAGALSLAQACANRYAQCRQLEAQIKDFESKSKRLDSLSETELVALFQLDRKISGGQSSELSRPVRTQLVSKLYVKASQAKTTQNWVRAIEYARKVLEADGSHTGAQAIVSEVRAQAKDVYLRGYQLKDTNPDEAIKLFKDVINMTPADDESHQKSKRWIGELSR